MNGAFAIIQEDIKELKETVYGNGKPGLKTELAVLQTELSAMKTELPEVNRRLGKVEKKIAMAAGALGALEIALKLIGH